MTGRRGSTRGLALPALLLALFVPVRAISLCCLGVAGPATGLHATHGPTPHHRPDVEHAPVGPVLGPAAQPACVAVTTSAPALRERGRAGDPAPGAGPAIAPVASVRDFGPPPRLAYLAPAPVSRPVGAETLHPLRL